MDSEDPVVRPKTGQNGRPYSVSKDEAYARMLQREEDSLAITSDEDFARQLQDELNMEERRKLRESVSNRPAMRAMTPITQLFSSLVGTRWNTGMDEDSDNENNSEENDNSDSDSTISGATASTTSTNSTATTARSSDRRGSNTATSPRSGATARGRNRGTTRSTRGLHGMRPTETAVTERPIAGSSRGRGTNRGTSRGRRGQATSRGATASSRGSRSTQGTSTENESTETRITGNRRSIPNSMEPTAPPLSLAINQPELPEGEMEPEIILLDRGESDDPDNRYVRIMRDPMLLLLFLMGRAPQMMVPDDVDASDYESLWQLAEELGEVKSRGLGNKELGSLPLRLYNKRTKVSGDGENQAECRVCLNGYSAGESVCTLPCKGKHEFHRKCVKEWLKRNASCPICRFELKS
ncbi:LOW QUALITY PROTEIN: E3 ubiquitin-protein ligase Praja-1-like [Pecten maximus]|uniref:LOW QUALITY PROTEIN: E3 ubiquitin-protein ligase Praja-1-like n=1 Tax=Pecten maximus TaxID=6579 RepID=UPI001458A973|nr:LOW QUALITY PROTEIN: E3 ubiquitin-protein ligase Praja-1-like [Pecten maximus]